MNPDPAVLIGLATRIAAAGILLQSLEVTCVYREFHDDGLLAWGRSGDRVSWLRRCARRLQQPPLVAVLMVLRAALAGGCLLASAGNWLSWCALAGLLGLQAYYNRRFLLVFANADHMNLVCLAALTIGSWPGAPWLCRASALGFMAFQSLLAYLMTGIDKVIAPRWRSGVWLVEIFQNSPRHLGGVGRRLERSPRLTRTLAWSVIALELGFPLCLVLPAGGFWLVLAAGTLFHAMIAVTMGLPVFFWAFLATYPALYFVHAWIWAGLRG